MQMLFFLAKRRRIDNTAVMKISFSLACRGFLIAAGIAVTGALLNANAAHAKARPL
jgi:hypothetical protein